MLQSYFEEYGHKCELNLNNPFHELKSNKNRFQIWLMKHKIINRKIILQRSRPRSFCALRNEMLCQLNNYPYVLHPYSWITFFCEIVWMITVLLFVIFLPFGVFKYIMPGAQSGHTDPEYLEMILSTICLFDCVRRFFTGYLIQYSDRDEIVLDFRRITMHYIKGYFFIDLLSSVPCFVELMFLSSPNYFLAVELFSYLKFFRLLSMLRVLRCVMRFRQMNENLTSIINSIMCLLFTVHWVSCISILVGVIDQRFNPNIIQWFNTLDKSLSRSSLYVTCLHRTTSIITGSGFNFFQHMDKDGNPLSEIGMLYTIFTAILGHILTMVIFAKICEKVQGMRSAPAKYEDMLNEVSAYMEHHKLPKTTQNKIKTYYSYSYEHSFFKEYEILESIPNVLRENVMLHCAKLLLSNADFFKQLPASVVANLVTHLGRDIIMAGDVIFHYGESGHKMYFILSGTVAAFSGNGREVAHIEDGGYFGQNVLIQIKDFATYPLTRVAIETCELLTLTSKEFNSFRNYCPDLVQEMVKVNAERVEMAALAGKRYEELVNKMKLLHNDYLNESL